MLKNEAPGLDNSSQVFKEKDIGEKQLPVWES